jgi:hypothetical protein
MPAPSLPYFFDESLRQRFAQDIIEAVGTSRIDRAAGQWLRSLVDTPSGAQPGPRVDRLLVGDATPVCAELAGAFVISDPQNPAAPIYISTIMFGIYRFDSRTALLADLRQRFPELASTAREIDVERVEEPLFTWRMQMILAQQASHLDTLSEQLHRLPTLQAAVGQALQSKIDAALPGSGVDVFTHLTQIVNPQAALSIVPTPPVLSTQTLADVAYELHVDEFLQNGLFRQFLDRHGAVLDQAQAGRYLQALSDTDAAVPGTYESMLDDYWSTALEDGRTMRQAAAQASAEMFRQELLRSRTSGLLSHFEFRRLRALLPSPGAAADEHLIRVDSLAVDITGHGLLELAGIFLIEFRSGELPGLYLFSSSHGFARIANRQLMNTYFTDDRSREVLLSHASLVDRALISAQEGALAIRMREIGRPLFEAHIEAVIELQKRNLRHVLGLPSISYDKAAVRVDDALDIRGLLDHRLLRLNGSWRWEDEATDFEQIWSTGNTALREPRGDLPAPSDTWADRVDSLEVLVEQLSGLHAGVQACMYRELNRYLALVVEPSVDARELWVGQAGGGPMTSLVEFALEQVSGAVPAEMPADWVVQKDSSAGQPETVDGLPPVLLGHILQLVLQGFSRRYEQQVRQFHTQPVRRIDTRISPAAISTRVRENALRLEVTIERRLEKISDAALDMIQQVLDRPVSSLRETLGRLRVETYAVALSFDLSQSPVALSNAFVLHNPNEPDRYVMWAVGVGIGDFDSLRSIEAQLEARLKRVDQCVQVLDLLSEPDRSRLEDYLGSTDTPVIRLVLSKIEGHLIQMQQAEEVHRQALNTLCAYHDAAAWRLNASIFSNLLDAAERDDISRRLLSALRAAIQSIIDITIVPAWVSNAAPLDQAKLLLSLQRFYIACGLQDDFLFNVPTLHDYARQQLMRKLETDFPTLALDPDSITVKLTHYVAAPVAAGEVPQAIPAATASAMQNLTAFAVNRFYSVQEGTLSVQMADGTKPGPQLTPLYLRAMVRSLDLATGYMNLLGAAFNQDNPTYGERQERFAQQMPALDCLRALVLRLQGHLSADACRVIGAVLEMPDALARLPVGGQQVMICPLRLLPAERGWAPATVLGTYVLAPLAPARGPWVLYSLLGNFVFKEYADENALLDDIHASDTLQSYLLERIDASMRKIYAHGGFQEPHLPFSSESSLDVPFYRPRPVSLKVQPYDGNAMELLFQGMLDTFLWQMRRRMVTNAEEWKNSSRYLFTLGAEQLLAFLPGRLGALVGIWQSRSLFNASAAAAGQKRWGKALSEFTAAISVLITSRHVTREELPQEAAASGHSSEIAPFLEFSWHNDGLTPEVRNRLRAFEAHNVALNTLRKNELFNTYRDDADGRTYVAISGTVYELEYDQTRWFIVSDNMRGPAVKLGNDQKWVLDIQGGLKGGGALISRMKGAIVEDGVDEILVVEANGMTEIRRVSRVWAESIENAHAQARLYLENALDNLTLRAPSNAIDTRAVQIVSEFFGQRTPESELYDQIRRAVTKIYEGLMHPSLSPTDSQRFVVGTNRRGHEPSSAFTFDHDPARRIFLTERFFRVPVYRLKTHVARSGSFSIAAHYHAAILIHELSHQVLKTEDIAYVDSHAPFLDLLEDTPGHRLRVKNEQIAQQQHMLSYTTDRSLLFKQLEDGMWRDLRSDDGDGKRAILRITGVRNLERARDVFYGDSRKRAEILLNNADSVALLITLLGRRRFAGRR